MRKKLTALLLCTAILAAPLAACDSSDDTGSSGGSATADLTPEPPEATDVPADTEAAIQAFAQALLGESLAEDRENTVISPLSAYYVLAMVALGAEGDTLSEFTDVLGVEPDALAGDLYSLAQRLTDTAGSTQLDIAGSIWTDGAYTVDEAFAQAMVDYFSAQVFSEDFTSQAAVDSINSWVSEQTNGLIDNMLDGIGEDTVMLLINTLYLNAKWAEAFNPMTETERIFYPETGAAVEVPFIHTGYNTLQVIQEDDREGVLLPYDDGNLGLLLLRPTDDTPIADFAAQVSLSDTLDGLEEHDDVKVFLPKFDIEYEVTMNDMLAAMGLEKVFTDESDLSGLIEEDDLLYISSVLQKVRIRVDEEGTEAAAATAVGVEAMSLPAEELTLTFDSPFYYAICDLETGLPLFIGVLNKPA